VYEWEKTMTEVTCCDKSKKFLTHQKANIPEGINRDSFCIDVSGNYPDPAWEPIEFCPFCGTRIGKMDIKTIAISEFVNHGYLHEANRQFFHPLGLALSIYENDDGVQVLDRVWDDRDSPEGFTFHTSTLDKMKAHLVETEQKKKHAIRKKHLGYIIQPVEDSLAGE